MTASDRKAPSSRWAVQSAWRRFCRSVTSALAAGVLATVAVAWWAAATARPWPRPSVDPTRDMTPTSFDRRQPATIWVFCYLDDQRQRPNLGVRWYPKQYDPGAGMRVFYKRPPKWSSIARSWSVPDSVRAADPGSWSATVEIVSGWPLLALMTTQSLDSRTWGRWRLGAGIVLESKAQAGDVRRSLPLIPIWPGFAVNTTLFALVWLGATGLLRDFVHSRRLSRGVCPACAYPCLGLPVSAPCPECGTAGRVEVRRE